MEERYDFDTTKLISFEFEECAGAKELAALRRQAARDEYELIIVDALCAIVRLRQMLL